MQGECRSSTTIFLTVYEQVADRLTFIKNNLIHAGVAQLVVQLIRNEQVACSSHVTSFTLNTKLRGLKATQFLFFENSHYLYYYFLYSSSSLGYSIFRGPHSVKNRIDI